MYAYIDIHTHHSNLDSTVFKLWNQIIGRDIEQDIVSSAGIHPWYIETNFEEQFERLSNTAQKESILAIGECGLDKISDTSWELQITAFERQIKLANKINKPLIIHCVRAYEEVLQSLRKQKNQVAVLFHGVHKKLPLIQSLHQKGYYTSFGAYILNGQQDDVIRSVDLDKIFLETDDKSTSIVDIYSYFCRVRNIPIEQLQCQLVQNVSKVFNYNIVPQ